MHPDIFQQILLAFALTLVSILAFFLRSLVQIGVEYLRAKLGESGFQQLRGYADVVVKMLEQSPAFQNFDGAKKKELAILSIIQYAEKNNLPIDRELIEKVIEAAVQEMNASKIEWNFIGGETPLLAGGSN